MMLLVQRYVSALAIVLIAFSAYALVAVPRIDPPVKLRAKSSTDATTTSDTGRRLKNNREKLQHLFPPDSWQLASPKVLETEHGTLLFKDYKPLEDGRIELKPLSLILNTAKGATGAKASARPMVLDAPDGALLQFDGATDPSRADFGRLMGGLLSGEIKIYSPPTAPGVNDALSIVTRNVQLDERRIWTPHQVNFRYGPSYGSGRDLVITLIPTEKSAGQASGPAFEGIKTLELVHLDKLHLESGGEALLPGKPKAAKKPANPSDPKTPPTPVEVTCQGPFLFDFVQRIASFEDHVDVMRLNANGPSDQLNCQLLTFHFKAPPAGAAPKQKGSGPAMSMEVERVVAVGHPVVLRAPSMGATARGERLEYHLDTRRIVLEDRDRVMLLDERFDIEARQLQYEMAENGGLGKLWAAGPGRLRARRIEPATVKTAGAARMRSPITPVSARPDNTAPATLEATWKKELRLYPHKGQHIVALKENATVNVAQMGGFAADEIYVWLNETPAGAAPSPSMSKALGGSGKMQVEPDRMLATGHVRINATQLEGETDRLELWIRKPAPVIAPLPTVPAPTETGAPPPSAPPPVPAAPAPKPKPLMPKPERTAPPGQKFHLLGDVIRIQLFRAGEETTVEEVTVDGKVKLWDEPLPIAGAKPQLFITGSALQLRGGMNDNAVVHVLGEPASIEAQGMKLRGANVHLHRSENRLWIEGPGDMQLPLSSDLSGKKLDAPSDVLITWQQGLEFDGAVALFGGNVQVQTANQQQWARAETLEVTMAKRVNFADAKPGVKPEVQQIAFDRNFALENRSLDKQGKLASIEKMQAESVRIEQQSGRMEADGPGWVSTVRLGGASNSLTSARGAAPPNPASRPTSAAPQFTYLFVEFQLQVVGNLFQHQVEFQRNVRTIYGPVDGWQGTLNIDQRPEQLNEQTVLMECQRLELREMPGSFRDTTSMEMEATGDTVVEGKGFTARASRIGYQDEKQLLTLEGDGRQDAELTRQTTVGGQQSHLKARKIMYWKFDNRVEVDDARMLDLNQLNALRPGR
jgi:lipopolysaccharide export system protein LptA